MTDDFESRSTSTSSEAENFTVDIHCSESFEEEIYNWYSQCLNRNLSINESMLKRKASSLCQEYGEETALRKDWLKDWRKKYGILQLPIINKALSAPTIDVFDIFFKKLIKDENVSKDQIFTCSETGLYYKMLPTSELICETRTRIPDFDITSDRVTIFACCNASGTLKLPLLLVDKIYKPNALTNFKQSNYPLIYQHQKCAWVDTTIIQKWFDTEFVPRVTKFLQEKDLPQKAILIIDNAPLHASEDKLRCGNIRSTLLNINVSSITRSINHEIMRDLKIRYRYRLLSSLLEYQHDEKDIMQRLEDISIKDVIFWITDAWTDVSASGIKRVWDRLWHRKKFVDFEQEDSMSVLDLIKLCVQIEGCEEVDKKDIEKYLNRDDKAMYNLSDEEIIEIVLQNRRENLALGNESTSKIHSHDAQEAMEVLITFLETQNVVSDDLVTLNRLRNKIKSCQKAELILQQQQQVQQQLQQQMQQQQQQQQLQQQQIQLQQQQQLQLQQQQLQLQQQFQQQHQLQQQQQLQHLQQFQMSNSLNINSLPVLTAPHSTSGLFVAQTPYHAPNLTFFEDNGP